jgi:putative DNA primase/helicase
VEGQLANTESLNAVGRQSPGTNLVDQSVAGDWVCHLQRDEHGKPLRNLTNTEIALTQSPDWQGTIGYDEFNGEAVLLRPPPWSLGKAGDVWNDNSEFHSQKWFENLPENARFTPSARTIAKTVHAIAHRHTFHPVRDYLDGRKWDGEPRLERWLTTYLRANDTS